MRKETTKERIVRTTTTGYIEADMLGQTLYISEEMKAKQNTPQRPHRKKMKQSISEMYIRGKLKEAVKWFQTAPTACWRRLKSLISFSNRYGRKLASLMRRNKRNGH